LEEDDNIMLHLGDASAIVDDLKKRNYSDDSVEMQKANNMLEYWTKRAARKGLNVSQYQEAPKAAPVASNTPAPAQASAAPKARTYEQIAEDIARLANDKEATLERVNELEGELDSVADSVPYGKVTESKNHLNSKKAELATGRWNEYNSRVKAALGEKDYNKRKAALEPLKEELGNYKGQEKYAEVEKSINDGLKKPSPDALNTQVILDNFTVNDAIAIKGELEKKKGDKVIPRVVTAGNKDRTVKFKLKANGDLIATNEKGGLLYTWPKNKLESWDNGKTPLDELKNNLKNVTEQNTSAAIMVRPPNQVANVLKDSTLFPKGRVLTTSSEDW
jgi:uncharacterized protein YbaA (DUF1428 family)